jgi:hypothetical protein
MQCRLAGVDGVQVQVEMTMMSSVHRVMSPMVTWIGIAA